MDDEAVSLSDVIVQCVPVTRSGGPNTAGWWVEAAQTGRYPQQRAAKIRRRGVGRFAARISVGSYRNKPIEPLDEGVILGGVFLADRGGRVELESTRMIQGHPKRPPVGGWRFDVPRERVSLLSWIHDNPPPGLDILAGCGPGRHRGRRLSASWPSAFWC